MDMLLVDWIIKPSVLIKIEYAHYSRFLLANQIVSSNQRCLGSVEGSGLSMWLSIC